MWLSKLWADVCGSAEKCLVYTEKNVTDVTSPWINCHVTPA